jgi:uncharacterized protein
MQLGDARTGKMADNLVAFGRALRRAGVPVDSARIALAGEAATLVDVGRRGDLQAALESTLVSRAQDREVFVELFDTFFRDPDVAAKLLAQMLPSAEAPGERSKQRPRVREALAPAKAPALAATKSDDDRVELDAAMTASEELRLRHADFNALGGDEYRLVERLARALPLAMPEVASRRTGAAGRGTRPHWARTLRDAGRSGGELVRLIERRRRRQRLPLLVLVDVSGSMERYARLLLAFLHAATRGLRRDVFAFGTHLTDLTPAFKLADTDAMLEAASRAIDDFAGGTRLGESLAALHRAHGRRLVGGRTLVLLVTDGLDTGEPDVLSRELDWLRLHSRRVLWLNPLLRFDGYQPLARGAAVLHRQAHGMLAVHNLARLEELAAAIAAVMQR